MVGALLQNPANRLTVTSMHVIQDSLELADLQRTGMEFISIARNNSVKLHLRRLPCGRQGSLGHLSEVSL